MFSVEQRDALREHLLRLAKQDARVVAAAAVGSLAADGGDRFSALDLSFGIADHVPVAAVLNAWTRMLIDQLDAVHLADLERGPTTYRVFLFPDALQVDLSMTPAAQFRPAGPRFRLLFGATAAGNSEGSTPPVAGGLFLATPPLAGDPFGWGVIYALHARACIERGRVWQAEHYVGAVRDHALSLACLCQGLAVVQARLRRPSCWDPGQVRGCPCWRGRPWGAAGSPGRLRYCAHASGRGGASPARRYRRPAPG